ncbi:murein transglycosylase A [Uliginosibacterium sp. H1]|uniref:murein transglycosylase A n=1 Tax=Uliginosibacterium sp. H1 TaxID=3114757 RepID=UPI002E18CBAB|nr:murein transglycosylase A [Uliginosibacterium sp. H1]
MKSPSASPALSAFCAVSVLALLAGCAGTPTQPAAPVAGPATPVQCPPVAPAPVCPEPRTPDAKPEPPPAVPAFQAADWSALPEWQRDDLAQAWGGLLASCRAIREPAMREAWSVACEAARALGDKPLSANIRAFMETHLQPWQIVNADGTQEGLVTGYYEPLIRASRWKSARFTTPVYGVPDDMLNLDLAAVYPETKGLRLRGRVEGRKVLPYWSREQIEAQGERFQAKVLAWAEDPVELFFLQVQGSGQAEFSDGSRVRLAYADQNGHPYISIGRYLINKGEMKLEQASMQGLKNWVKANPSRLSELLNANPSYVFFREEAAGSEGPKGSLGVPLAAGRAIAVDPRTVPLGAPVFISFPKPEGGQMNRLVMAQDTGGAIRGRVRADFFWGFGAEAGAQAGRMRQQGRMWLLWPRAAVPPPANP